MASAETSWTIASTNAPEASHTLTVSGPENPAMFTAIPVGSCTFP
jgi:hypothetical protein